MTVARLHLARVIVVVARWLMDLDVVFVTSSVLFVAMMFDEWIRSFHPKKDDRTHLLFLQLKLCYFFRRL